jgi:hypothetical protein
MQELAELSAETRDIALSRFRLFAPHLSSIDHRGRRGSSLLVIPKLVACRRKFVTADAAGSVGILPPNRSPGCHKAFSVNGGCRFSADTSVECIYSQTVQVFALTFGPDNLFLMSYLVENSGSPANFRRIMDQLSQKHLSLHPRRSRIQRSQMIAPRTGVSRQIMAVFECGVGLCF